MDTKRTIQLVGLLSLSSLAGCAGVMINAIEKSIGTGKPYAEMLPFLPPIQPGNYRIFIYRSETSTNYSLRYGMGIVKNPANCLLDETPIRLIWEAFHYIDIPAGNHEVSCGNVYSEEGFFGKPKWQRGENKISIAGTASDTTYVRIDAVDGKAAPKLVEKSVSIVEISKLPFQKARIADASGSHI